MAAPLGLAAAAAIARSIAALPAAAAAGDGAAAEHRVAVAINDLAAAHARGLA